MRDVIYDYYRKKYPNPEIKGYVVYDEDYEFLSCNKELDNQKDNLKDITENKEGIIKIQIIENHAYEIRFNSKKPSNKSKDPNHYAQAVVKKFTRYGRLRHV